jgi:hypothetical protein
LGDERFQDLRFETLALIRIISVEWRGVGITNVYRLTEGARILTVGDYTDLYGKSVSE